ncbi:MAG: hypothetical protein ACLTG4_02125 [Oscillospiraceae bacterium]
MNLLDEAQRKRITVDLPELQAQLGVRSCVTARKRKRSPPCQRVRHRRGGAAAAAGRGAADNPADDVRRAEPSAMRA